ncbi:peptidase family M1-domain-containing protein [Boletus edulis]|nr:peptidase family M1-domain-containing protein [Boletus edulis]
MAARVSDRDPTTQSNYTKIATTNLSLDWTVDFDKRCIHGSATHQATATEDVSEVIFDTRVLDIESVEVNGHVVETHLDPEHPVMGSALHVPLPRMRAGETVSVKITYKTTEQSPALLWLDKELTEGKAFPYLFSQCQPIHARSVAPLQDTPSVKLTYDAKVTCVLPVLLSARRVSPPSDGPPHGGKVIGTDAVTYEYKQAEPIPSYLLAIAAGDLRYRPFVVPDGRTWSCGVWTEPKLLEDAYNEFCEDTPRYLAAAEDLAGPYRFGVYDLLVLPHSFPYGGMENPCISFVTPTLITGDRSLTDVVIHELTHSWFGNGVTHAHASHFWLNEGWTTYIERVLQGLVHSSGHRGLSYVIGHKSLVDALEQFQSTPKYQRLVIPFEVGEDPDGAYSRVPYDKGANLLLHVERTLGGIDVILPYVKEYVKTYMGHSITTAQCKDHLYSFFANQADKIKDLDRIDWNAWFYGEGVTLPVEMEYDLTLVTAAYDLADRWNATRDVDDPDQLDFKPSDIDPLDSNQRVVFLKRLETYLALPTKHVLHLDGLYRFSQTTNSEIRMAFYLVALKEPTSAVAKLFVQSVLDWVIGKDTGVIQGRMKFCRPLFRVANKVDREKTVAAYESARTLFHPIARKLIEQDLGLSG